MTYYTSLKDASSAGPVSCMRNNFPEFFVLLTGRYIGDPGHSGNFWIRAWTLREGEQLGDGRFSGFVPDELVHQTTIALPSSWGGGVFSYLDVAHAGAVLEWLVERDALWSVRPEAIKDDALLRFSFANPVLATEFKLTWG